MVNVSWYAEVVSRPELTQEDYVSRVSRRLDNVVVTNGPNEIQRVVGEGMVISRLEWTMVATDPYVYRDERVLFIGPPLGEPTYLDGSVTHESNAQILNTVCEIETVPALTFADDPNCVAIEYPPAVPVVEELCSPESDQWQRQKFLVDSDVFGTLDSVLVFKFTSAASSGTSARVRIWDADEPTECGFLEEVWIDYLAEDVTLSIEPGGGVTVEKAGLESVRGDNLIRGSYRGPYSPVQVGLGKSLRIAVDVAYPIGLDLTPIVLTTVQVGVVRRVG